MIGTITVNGDLTIEGGAVAHIGIMAANPVFDAIAVMPDDPAMIRR
ncbi:hypothetical protein [Caenibius tardaugens]|nr:hypothetical protein [Caenibius tardaugens]